MQALDSRLICVCSPDRTFTQPFSVIRGDVRDAYKISQASRRPLDWLKMKNLDALAVEKKTASELAEMVATRLGISAAAIKVMPDPVHGWRAMVIGPRTTVSKYQPQADRTRDELCTQYEL